MPRRLASARREVRLPVEPLPTVTVGRVEVGSVRPAGQHLGGFPRLDLEPLAPARGVAGAPVLVIEMKPPPWGHACMLRRFHSTEKRAVLMDELKILNHFAP